MADQPNYRRIDVTINRPALSFKGVEVILYGKTLINAATIDIIKTHRIARRYTGTALSRTNRTDFAALAGLDLSPCRIDIGQLGHQYWQHHTDENSLDDFLQTALLQ